MLADDELFVVQMRDHFDTPVFHRHRLPLVRARFADAFAKLSGHDPETALRSRLAAWEAGFSRVEREGLDGESAWGFSS